MSRLAHAISTLPVMPRHRFLRESPPPAAAPRPAPALSKNFTVVNQRLKTKNGSTDFDISNIMSTSSELSIKLFIDTKAQKVCFAEAGNDVVEFLACLLCLPMSTIIKVLTKDRVVGSIGNLHDSLRGLDAKYVFSDQINEPSLRASVVPVTISTWEQLQQPPLNSYSCFFTCEGMPELHSYPVTFSCGYLSAISGAICPQCSKPMRVEMRHIQAHGYVRTTDKYTITDDLSIKLASSVSSSIALLVQCGVKDLSTVEEQTVKIGKNEALEILHASMNSRTVLTDAFLRNKSTVKEEDCRFITESDSSEKQEKTSTVVTDAVPQNKKSSVEEEICPLITESDSC